MGFAKYQEDIVSRYVSDNREKEKVTAQQKLRNGKMNETNQQKQNMDLKQFVIQKARPLPVIILADTSASMSVNGKIEALNDAIKDMIDTFSEESRRMAEINVCLVIFGDEEANIHQPLTPAHELKDLKRMNAIGRTPMGGAFKLVERLIEDRELIPSRAYRPALVLLSDGHPTDDWKEGLQVLLSSERAQKATRFAMAIGDDADETILQEFINDPEAPLFRAHQARDIHRFFRAVTMSVTARTKSQSPDSDIKFDFDELLDEDDLESQF